MLKTLELQDREFIQEFGWTETGHGVRQSAAPPEALTEDMERRVEEMLDLLDQLEQEVSGVTGAESGDTTKTTDINTRPRDRCEGEPIDTHEHRRQSFTEAPQQQSLSNLTMGRQSRSKRTSVTGCLTPPRATVRRFMDIALWAAVLCVLIVSIVHIGNPRDGFHLFGYSGFTVHGGSMHSEIPEGSLVLTQKTDTKKIIVGDDITFFNRDNSIVTHRVVDIVENYKDGKESQDRGFLTQGIANKLPDGDIVYSENVIGVVKSVIPGLGAVLTYFSENTDIFLILPIIIILIIRFITRYKCREDDSPNAKKTKRSEKIS